MPGTRLQAPGTRHASPLTWKNQMYMIWEGTGSAVWLMSHGCDGLQIAQWNRQKLLARVSHLSRREVPHRILLAHLPRTLPPAQSFCTAGKQLWFLVSKLSKEHQNLLLRGWKHGDNLLLSQRKGKGWAGWESLVFADAFSASVSAQDLLPQNQGPFGVSSASLAIYQHIAD